LITYSRQNVSFLDAFRVAWQVKFKSLTQGEKIREFEFKVAEYVGARYAVAVSSGTAGLHLAHLALGHPEGANVVTSPISFVATANSIIYASQNPIFVDIELNSGNLSVEELRKTIETLDVKTIVPVHYAGTPCDMKKIYEIAKNKRINIIEDAAHALGGYYESGEKIGSCNFSDMTVFSFHPVKSITTGEGGIITTNDEHLYKKLLQLRTHGIHKNEYEFEEKFIAYTDRIPNTWYYEMNMLGYHYRMTDIQAALGCSQMNKLDKFMRKRRKLATRYNELLINLKNIKLLSRNSISKSANHLYPILINFEKIKYSRNELMLKLKKSKITTQVHYIPIPMHPFYRSRSYTMDNLPNALNFYFSVLSIPIHPGLTQYRQLKVIKNLKNLISE